MNKEFKGDKLCAICGGEIKDVILKIFEQQIPGLGLIVFENISAQECQKCGEQWFSSKVIRALDRTINEKKSPARTIEVPVYQLALASV
ncbi:YgiT-type zinc finger protein [bacterium]|nr:YgiT-type zinc finger protein [bacterium]MBU1753856.1 YgiT-type zinc finger protein [bacterium]